MNPIEVLVVEDDRETREWLCDLAREAFAQARTAGVATLQAARERCARAMPDLALVDVHLPDGSGIDLVAALARGGTGTLCVMTTIFDDDAHLFAALRAGAAGYLVKDQDPARLVRALRGIVAGEPPLSPGIARRILAHFQEPAAIRTPPDAALSPREHEVLTLVAKGYSRGEIARLLGITPNTAAGYVKSVYRKLDCSNRAEAVLAAVRLGLVRPGG